MRSRAPLPAEPTANEDLVEELMRDVSYRAALYAAHKGEAMLEELETHGVTLKLLEMGKERVLAKAIGGQKVANDVLAMTAIQKTLQQSTPDQAPQLPPGVKELIGQKGLKLLG